MDGKLRALKPLKPEQTEIVVPASAQVDRMLDLGPCHPWRNWQCLGPYRRAPQWSTQRPHNLISFWPCHLYHLQPSGILTHRSILSTSYQWKCHLYSNWCTKHFFVLKGPNSLENHHGKGQCRFWGPWESTCSAHQFYTESKTWLFDSGLLQFALACSFSCKHFVVPLHFLLPQGPGMSGLS